MLTLSVILIVFLSGVSLGGIFTWDFIEEQEQKAIQQARAELLPDLRNRRKTATL